MSTLPQHIPLPRKNQGITLVIGLMMLLLLTLIGTTAIKTSSYEQRMSGGMRDLQVSFQSAESGLLNGEAWIGAQFAEPIPIAAGTPPYVQAADPDLFIEDQTDTWWNANAEQLPAGTISGVSSQPYYHVQFVTFKPDNLVIGHGSQPGKHYYSVSSKASGGNADTNSILQTTFTRRF